ncbi:MAG: hypothetical protein US13_C0007G0029 [candidate division TM6 bacterium GW2011_GWE2_36_25]|nr:MAG: hypothetical protein US13_C0007G0029 [candidate division TM6 bacterium GW2011_GWE2_36_25]
MSTSFSLGGGAIGLLKKRSGLFKKEEFKKYLVGQFSFNKKLFLGN